MTPEQSMADEERSLLTGAPLDLRVANDVNAYLTGLQTVVATIPREPLMQLTAALARASQEGRTVFILGNGGSAATASHLACDLAKTAAVAGMPPLRAVALTDNMPLITAIGNDLSYDRVFSEQLRIFGRSGDLAIIISASGNSPNVLAAAEVARELDMLVVGFCGFGGGKLKALSDLSLVIDSSEYGPVEDAHMIVSHALTVALRAAMQRTHATHTAVPGELDAAEDALVAPVRIGAERESLTIFLDRDGVINRNSDDYVKRWSEFEFLPGSLEALARLRQAGHRVFVVTNQACIAKGLTTREEVDDLHQRMRQAVERAGGAIEDIFICPHHPLDHCGCRKPRPGLIAQACDRYRLDLSRAVLIGDSATDMGLARNAGIPAILVLTGLGHQTATALSPQELRDCHVALSLDHATQLLRGEETEDEAMLRLLLRRARARQWIMERQRVGTTVMVK